MSTVVNCQVCGDRPIGFNFGAVTCDSCRSFFRRCSGSEKMTQCPFNGQCDINVNSRRFCQACRLKKCLEVGMSHEEAQTKNKPCLAKRPRPWKKAKVKRIECPDEPFPQRCECTCRCGFYPPTLRIAQVLSAAQQQNSTDVNFVEWSGSLSVNCTPTPGVTAPVSSLPPPQGLPLEPKSTTTFPTNSPTAHSAATSTSAVPTHSARAFGSASAFVPTTSHDSSFTAIGSGPSASTLAAGGSSTAVAALKFERHASAVAPGDSPRCTDPSPLLATDPPLACGAAPCATHASPSLASPCTANALPFAANASPFTGNAPPFLRTASPFTTNASPFLRTASPFTTNASPFLGTASPFTTNASPFLRTASPFTTNASPFLGTASPFTTNASPFHRTASPFTTNASPFTANAPTSGALPTTAVSPTATWGSPSAHESSDNHFAAHHRRLLDELIAANDVLKAPMELSLQGLENPNELSLMAVVRISDLAMRRIIAMVKKLDAFRRTTHADQIALLKGGLSELLILRGVMVFDGAKDAWIHHIRSGTQQIRLSVDLLKKSPEQEHYDAHKRFLASFDEPWRTNEPVMLILNGILLFSTERNNLSDVYAVEKAQRMYIDLLKAYLDQICADPQASSHAYTYLMVKLKELRELNRSLQRIYYRLNPDDLEPLLRELFSTADGHG